MNARVVIEWQACKPLGERADLVEPRGRALGGAMRRLLGHVWPKRRVWCASDAAGRFLGSYKTREAARRRVVAGQVLNGQPVLVRSKG
ncbi:MAG TPA: hypothetical protein VF768_11715 [Holophagaceae bacterium]